jgi:hypothetical protein
VRNVHSGRAQAELGIIPEDAVHEIVRKAHVKYRECRLDTTATADWIFLGLGITPTNRIITIRQVFGQLPNVSKFHSLRFEDAQCSV